MAEDKEKKMSKEELTAMRVANLRKNQYRGGRKPTGKPTRQMRGFRLNEEEYEIMHSVERLIKKDKVKAEFIRAFVKDSLESLEN